MLGRFAVSAVVVLVGMLLVVGHEVEHLLGSGGNIVIAFHVLQHIHLALQGDDGGVKFIKLPLAAEQGEHAVDLRQPLFRTTDARKHQTQIGLSAQGFGLVAVLSAEVNQLRRPVDGLLVVAVLATGMDKHFQHVLPIRQIFLSRVGRHQSFADDDGGVEPHPLQRLTIDLGPQIVAAVVGQRSAPLQRGSRRVNDREVARPQSFNHHQCTVGLADGLLQHPLVDGPHLVVRQPLIVRSPSAAHDGQHGEDTYCIYVPDTSHIHILV